MNPIVEALPQRPIMRDEIDELTDSESIDAVFPVFGERSESRQMAFVLVVATGETLHGIGLDEGGWSLVDTATIEAVADMEKDPDEDSVFSNDMQAVQDMQQYVVDSIDKEE